MPTTHHQRWQALSDLQDAMYAGADDLTQREARILEIRNAALVWEMVQLDPTGYLPDDYRNYKRAGERAARWLATHAGNMEDRG